MTTPVQSVRASVAPPSEPQAGSSIRAAAPPPVTVDLSQDSDNANDNAEADTADESAAEEEALPHIKVDKASVGGENYLGLVGAEVSFPSMYVRSNANVIVTALAMRILPARQEARRSGLRH
jgi:hypothetical protein